MKRLRFQNYEVMLESRAQYIRQGYTLESYANPRTGEYWIEIKTVPTEVVQPELEGK